MFIFVLHLNVLRVLESEVSSAYIIAVKILPASEISFT